MGDVRVSDQRGMGSIDNGTSITFAEAAEAAAPVAAAQTAVVRPGDTLIVRVDPRATTRKLADQLIEGLEGRFSDVKVVVIAAEEMVIYRPEAPRFEITAGPDVTPEQAERFASSMQRSESIRRRTA
jgi:hypothetical protein